MSKIKVENNPYLNRGIGLFSQTGLSTPIVNTTSELSLIDGGVGTLSVPANGFKVGDTFWAYMAAHDGIFVNHLAIFFQIKFVLICLLIF